MQATILRASLEKSTIPCGVTVAVELIPKEANSGWTRVRADCHFDGLRAAPGLSAHLLAATFPGIIKRGAIPQGGTPRPPLVAAVLTTTIAARIVAWAAYPRRNLHHSVLLPFGLRTHSSSTPRPPLHTPYLPNLGLTFGAYHIPSWSPLLVPRVGPPCCSGVVLRMRSDTAR